MVQPKGQRARHARVTNEFFSFGLDREDSPSSSSSPSPATVPQASTATAHVPTRLSPIPEDDPDEAADLESAALVSLDECAFKEGLRILQEDANDDGLTFLDIFTRAFLYTDKAGKKTWKIDKDVNCLISIHLPLPQFKELRYFLQATQIEDPQVAHEVFHLDGESETNSLKAIRAFFHLLYRAEFPLLSTPPNIDFSEDELPDGVDFFVYTGYIAIRAWLRGRHALNFHWTPREHWEPERRDTIPDTANLTFDMGNTQNAEGRAIEPEVPKPAAEMENTEESTEEALLEPSDKAKKRSAKRKEQRARKAAREEAEKITQGEAEQDQHKTEDTDDDYLAGTSNNSHPTFTDASTQTETDAAIEAMIKAQDEAASLRHQPQPRPAQPRPVRDVLADSRRPPRPAPDLGPRPVRGARPAPASASAPARPVAPVAGPAHAALVNELGAALEANAGLPPVERRAAFAREHQRLLRSETLAAARGEMPLRATATVATQAALTQGREDAAVAAAGARRAGRRGGGAGGRGVRGGLRGGGGGGATARPAGSAAGRAFDIGGMPGWLGELEAMQVAGLRRGGGGGETEE